MILIYIAFCIATIFMGKSWFKKWFNPITVYSLVWMAAVSAHQSGLIYYYDLSAFTWLTIFLFHTIFVFSCYIGNRVHFRGNTTTPMQWDNNDQLKEKMRKYIWITLIIAAVAIVGNLLYAISIYGTNLFASMTDIYSNRVNRGEDLGKIPYLSSFIYVSIALSGIYLRKYGFCVPIILTFLLGATKVLTSGGRAGLIFIVIIFASTFLITPGGEKKRKEQKKEKKRYIIMAIAIIVLAVFFLIVSKERAAGQLPTYATNLYESIFGTNVLVYKIATYIAGPIGALNEYLKTCNFNFGQNTFKTIFNAFAKLGIMERVDQYQEFFRTPSSCNVATWIRELVEDFTYPGGIMVAEIVGFIVGGSFRKASKYKRISSILICSIWLMVMALSFFDWKLRSSDIWIALLGCYFFGRLLDKESKNSIKN